MEIYFKNEDGQLQGTTVQGILTHILKDSDVEFENFYSSDSDDSTFTLTKRIKNKLRIDIQLELKDSGNKLTGFSIFNTPIKVVEDCDRMTKII
ncbi:hypothetical protein AAU57_12185 [Nonlabens sp. YIK11]|uniref:hypothetical protein n=1 Tax=Nonlabens sp. YIK11 TaxID=1453349 RepID=UPI000707A36F|nr:hypothetical protein [Nonlabens sp. YIK11]KQC34005.1 hypothetical protein AAU57_12185 [Nonlabens sp. YIK11]